MTRRSGRRAGRATTPGRRLLALALVVVLLGAPATAGIGFADAAAATATATGTISGCTTIDSPGVYTLDSDITTTANTCIDVNDHDVVIDANGHTITSSDGGGTAISIVGTDAAHLSNVTIRNATLVGWNDSVDAAHVTDLTLRKLVARNGTHGTAIRVVGAAGTVTLRRVRVSDYDNPGDAAAVLVENATGAATSVTATNLTVVDVGEDGVEFSVSGDVTVSDLYVNGTGEDAIEITTTGNVSFTNVRIEETGDGGATIDATGRVTIHDVEVDGIEYHAIDVETSGNVSITDVRIRNITLFHGRGVEVYAYGEDVPGNITVDDVFVRNVSGDALRLKAKWDVTVTDVRVVHTEADGLDLTTREGRAVVTNVTITDAYGEDGIEADIEENVTVSDVRVSGTGSEGVTVDSGDGSVVIRDVVVHNTSNENVVADAEKRVVIANVEATDVASESENVEIRGGDDVLIENVRLKNATRQGVAIRNIGNATLRNVSITNASKNGLLVTGTTNLTVHNVSIENVHDVEVFVYHDNNDTFTSYNTSTGILVKSSGHAELSQVLVHTVDEDGIRMRDVDTATLRRVGVANVSDEYFVFNGTVATLDGIALGESAVLSGEARDVSLSAAPHPRVPPSGTYAVDAHFRATNLSSDAYLEAVVTYREAAAPSLLDESSLRLYRNTSSGWTKVGGTVDPAADTVSKRITNFSTFGVFGVPLPPRFTLSNVTATGPVDAGETVTVEATVRNEGGNGTQTIELRRDGSVVDSVDVDLGHDESRTVTLSYTTASDDAGDLALTVATANESATTTVDVRSPSDGGGGGGGGGDDGDGDDEPAFTVDASLSASDVRVDDPVTVRVTVTNVGSAAGTFIVQVTVDGVTHATTAVALNPGESKTVTATFTPNGTGTYRVSVNGESVGAVTVSPGPTPTATPSPTPTPTATPSPTPTPTAAPTPTPTPAPTGTSPAGTDATPSTEAPSPSPAETTTPGFGIGVALVALLAALLVVLRRPD